MTPAEQVVVGTINRLREEDARGCCRISQALKPRVQSRTGAPDSLYWRALRLANELFPGKLEAAQEAETC